MKVYFSDIFDVNPDFIEEYGAFNISLITDLPLFVDPFLLFNSKKEEYQDRSLERIVDNGLLKNWFFFPGIKKTWLGYSKVGNSGRGPGIEFARALTDNLNGIFSDFDKQTISQSPHLEKLCLIKDNIGRDNISDFVTNLIKNIYLNTRKYLPKNILNQLN